jgi:hypothetical protein
MMTDSFGKSPGAESGSPNSRPFNKPLSSNLQAKLLQESALLFTDPQEQEQLFPTHYLRHRVLPLGLTFDLPSHWLRESEADGLASFQDSKTGSAITISKIWIVQADAVHTLQKPSQALYGNNRSDLPEP